MRAARLSAGAQPTPRRVARAKMDAWSHEGEGEAPGSRAGRAGDRRDHRLPSRWPRRTRAPRCPTATPTIRCSRPARLPNATNEQWDLASPAGGFDRGISIDRAWPLSTGTGTTLAEIDVGAQLDHPDLAGRFTGGWDFYSGDDNPVSDSHNSHGTNVAGVLGRQLTTGSGSPASPRSAADGAAHLRRHPSPGHPRRARHRVCRRPRRQRDLDEPGHRHLQRPAAPRGRLRPFQGRLHGQSRQATSLPSHHHYPQVLDDVMAVAGVNPNTADTTAMNGNLASVATDFTVRAHYSDYGRPHRPRGADAGADDRPGRRLR